MSTLLIILERQVSLQEYGKAWIAGIKSMLGAIAILFFAWTINKVVGDAQTGKYLSSLVSGSIPVQFYLFFYLYLVRQWRSQQGQVGEHLGLCYQSQQQWQPIQHQSYYSLVFQP